MTREFKREIWCETCKHNSSLKSYFTTHTVKYLAKRGHNFVLLKSKCTVCKKSVCREVDREVWWDLYKGIYTHFKFR